MAQAPAHSREVCIQSSKRKSFQHAGSRERVLGFAGTSCGTPTWRRVDGRAQPGGVHSKLKAEVFAACRITGASSRLRGDIVRHSSLEAGGWCRRWQTLCEVPVPEYKCGFQVSLCTLCLRIRACLCLFVLHAPSCLCRLLHPQCRKEQDIDKGDGRSSRSLHGDKQPQHSGEQPELVEAGPRVLTPPLSPYLREGVGSGVPHAYGGFYASSEDSSESS
jgi:hypothetical protein